MRDPIGSLLNAIVRLVLWLAGVSNPLAMQVEDGYRALAVGCGLFLAGCLAIGLLIVYGPLLAGWWK